MMNLDPAPGPLPAVTLPSGANSIQINVQFNCRGGIPPYVFTPSAVLLPEGLTLNSSGLLSGTITQTGYATYNDATPSDITVYNCNIFVHFLMTDAGGNALRGIYYLPVRTA